MIFLEGRARVFGTYSGVRIVRSATGLQDLDTSSTGDDESMDDESSELVRVTINRSGSSDARMRSLLMGNNMGGPHGLTRSRRGNLDGTLGPVTDTVLLFGNRPRRNNLVINCPNRYQVPPDHKIHKNFHRLTHYIQEANVGRGFIKELCYSNDGRIICSPYSHGIRLLSFSPNCDELSTLIPKLPAVRLHELGTNVSHGNTVLCTKFSPIHPLLVSGCLSGRIVWYQPRI